MWILIKIAYKKENSKKSTYRADMSNTIEGDIDIDFLGVLTLTIDIELVTFE